MLVNIQLSYVTHISQTIHCAPLRKPIGQWEIADVNVKTIRDSCMRLVGKPQSFHVWLVVINTPCLSLTSTTFPRGVRIKSAQTLGLRVRMKIWA